MATNTQGSGEPHTRSIYGYPSLDDFCQLDGSSLEVAPSGGTEGYGQLMSRAYSDVDGMPPSVYQPNHFALGMPGLTDDSANASGVTESSADSVPQMALPPHLDYSTSPFAKQHFRTDKDFNHHQSWNPAGFPTPSGSAMGFVTSTGSPYDFQSTSTAKRAFSETSSTSDSSANSKKAGVLRCAADAVRIPEGQDTLLQHFVDSWKTKTALPSRQELKNMAALVKMSVEHFSMWFGANAQLKHVPLAEGVDQRPAQTPTPEIAQMIHSYIVKHNNQACSSSAGHGMYRCSWAGCSYSTKRRDAWVQHEETRQPQRFWICVDCTSGEGEAGRTPHINHRGDKFLDHARTHSAEPQYCKELRDRSEVDHVAPFRSRCMYTGPGKTACKHRFRSWDERLEHYENHYRSELGSGSSARPRKRRARARNDHPSDSVSNGETTSVPVGTHNSDIPGHFIDIERSIICNVNLDLPYVALNYDCVRLDPTPTFLHDHAALDPNQDKCPIPPALQHAITFTQQLGVRYLWIESPGRVQTNKKSYELKNIYQRAVFIVVAGSSQKAMRVTQFACAFDQMATVQSWIYQEVTLRRLQHLGQGTFSVVEKVEASYFDETKLRLSIENYARKTITRHAPTKVSARPSPLHEIEIMRKFKHPHIAKFVAAYLQDNALHILMTPVADYDLRQYLSQPDLHSQERPYLLNWFLCLADALAYVHGMDCRHKDIKPANVLISSHQVLLSDFGASTHFDEDQSMTSGHAFMTPKYCAPEVAALEERGRSADVWSLGCVFLEMLTVLHHYSLDDLHVALDMEGVSKDRRHTYHNHWHEALAWLKALHTASSRLGTLHLINLTTKMLSRMPSQRPVVTDVVRGICGRSECEHCESLSVKPPRRDCHCSDSARLRGQPFNGTTNPVPAMADVEPQGPVQLGLAIDRSMQEVVLRATFDGSSLHLRRERKLWSVALGFPEQDKQRSDPWSTMNGQLYRRHTSAELTLSGAQTQHQGIATICFRGRIGSNIALEIDAECLDRRGSILRSLPWLKLDHAGWPGAIDYSRVQKMLRTYCDNALATLKSRDIDLIKRWCKAQIQLISSVEDASCWVVTFGKIAADTATGYGGSSIFVHNTRQGCADDGTQQQIRLVGSNVPVRLVHCGKSDDEIYLAESWDTESHYVALSCCWGQQSVLGTTVENYTAFTKHIPASLLPAELLDSIQITRDLGFEYLWVDSLCVIHDDKEERIEALRNMARVFASAALTLVAAPEHARPPGALLSDSNNSEDSDLAASPQHDLCTYCHSAWGARQKNAEHWLHSPRVLHFSPNWLFYESESGCTIAGRASVCSLAVAINSRHAWSILDAMRKCTLQELKIA